MKFRTAVRIGAIGAAAFAFAGALPAFTANNPVPRTYASDTTSAISANNLKPSQCSGITLTAKITASPWTGGAAAELIVGTTAANTMTGNGGDDCILGGAGIDALRGNAGNDVLIGGDGNDTLTGGAGTDACYGGGGVDTFATCETTDGP